MMFSMRSSFPDSKELSTDTRDDKLSFNRLNLPGPDCE